MNLLGAIIELAVFGLCLYWVYKWYKKYNCIIGSHINEIVNDWPKLPDWLNWALGILLFIGCVFVQVRFFFESLIIWLILLFIFPLFYRILRNGKIRNMLSVIVFFLIAFFSVTLFFNVDNSRDIIGKAFIADYNVYYKTEFYQTRYDDGEVEVAHVNTGNYILDFFLESIFPYAYRIAILLLCVVSFLLNISFKQMVGKNYENTS